MNLICFCLLLLILVIKCLSSKCYSPLSPNNNNNNNKIGEKYKNLCFTLYDQPVLQFNDAQKYCKENFHPLSNVVKIDSQEMTLFLINLRLNNNPLTTTSGIWIGLVNNKWISDNTTLNYTNWESLEPSGDGFYTEMFVNGKWNDVPETKYRSFYCSFPLETCQGITHGQNKTEICSNVGSCMKNNTCQCNLNINENENENYYNDTLISCYTGQFCEIPKCENILATNISYVCSEGKGNCIKCDFCNCSKTNDTYGNNCQEFIKSIGILNKNEKSIHIPYQIPEKDLIKIIPSYNSFLCSILIENYLNIFFGINPICSFLKSPLLVNNNNNNNNNNNSMILELKITYIQNNHPIIGNYLSIIPITMIGKNTEQRAIIKIIDEPQLPQLKQTQPFNIINIINIIVIVLLIPVIIIIIIIIVIVIISCIFLLLHKKTQSSSLPSLKITNKDEIDLIDAMDSCKDMAKIKINKELFSIDYDELKIMKKIGKGGFANVYLAQWKGNLIAFKLFDTSFLGNSENNFSIFEKEFGILASINHPNIVHCYGATLKIPRIGILLEYCKSGDLFNYIKVERIGDPLDFESKLSFIRNICSGMEYLHNRKIIHRDLKLENILISDNNIAKITDFGISSNSSKLTQRTQNIGTSYYIAPEIVINGKYDFKCDVFSFGILFYILWTEKFNPYENIIKNNFKIERKIAMDPKLRPIFSETFLSSSSSLETTKKKGYIIIKLIKDCWDHDPNKRPSFKKILEILE